MTTLRQIELHLGLVHYPVIEKNGNIITSAVTNLDIHDLARLVKTYNLGKFYIIHPQKSQQELIKRVIKHWTDGLGAKLNQDRKEAFDVVRLVSSIEEAEDDIFINSNIKPLLIATTARRLNNQIEWDKLINVFMNQTKNVYLVLLGTAHGLANEVFEKSHYILSPIKTEVDYNHLSVRCAAAIIMDRIYNIYRNIKQISEV